MLETVRCAILGYGPLFDMGKYHASTINRTPGMTVTAICDIDPKQVEKAGKDFPGVALYTDPAEMLKAGGFELVTVVTPHNNHASLAIQCLEAGKNVITEKPMCVTVEEATQMIETAKAKGLMLSVHHNRRWDGDYMAMKEVIESGKIGEIFHVEMWGGSYGRPLDWWRSYKEISGGLFYDWGAHFVDWLLGLIPSKMESISGHFHKLVWNEFSNEDHVEAIIKFKNGCVASVQQSSIAFAGKPRWIILGTKGAIVQEQDGKTKLITEIDGIRVEGKIPDKKSNWGAFYQNIAGHLLRGEALAVTPESARRAIAVMNLAEESSKLNKPVEVPFED